jgi:hypothetical protein
MQDFNYWAFGCMEVTIELSCCKYPKASELAKIWQENKQPLIEYLKLANTGLRGLITYSNGKPAKFLSVQIDSREPIFKTNERGEYYRLLTSGSYKLSLLFNCELIYETTIQISNNSLLVLNITLPMRVYKQSIKNYENSLDKYPIFCKSASNIPSCSNAEFKQIIKSKQFTTISSAYSSSSRTTVFIYYTNTIFIFNLGLFSLSFSNLLFV